VDDALRPRARERTAAFAVAAAVALALAWPSLRWPMVYDDLHQIRGYTAADVAAAFRGRSDPDGIETQGLRPLNLLFNHAQYTLFGEGVVAHRLFLAALHALYAAILALIVRRFGLPLPFALLAMALAMCARYSVYHYVWLVEGHHYVQGLLFEGSLLALPYAAGDRQVALDRPLSFALLALAGWIAFAWRILDLALIGAFQFDQPAQLVTNGPGLWVTALGELPVVGDAAPGGSAATGSARKIGPCSGSAVDASGGMRPCSSR